jgi:nicotinate-nucleotide pyrophosphorylase (carboxylating)
LARAHNKMEIFRQLDLDALVKRALDEDLGQGDITTAATVKPGQQGRARITVKEPSMIFCGGILLERVFRLAGAKPIISSATDGTSLVKGDLIAEIEGALAGLLIGERTALNFIQLMSGIATATHQYVEAIKGTRAKIVDTRKTHPGLRAVEKYAVRCGGGTNHRFGLDGGVLIKDNHIAAAGSIRAAIEGAKKITPHTLRIEIECETLAQVEEARAAGADIIMLDNMNLESMARARQIVGHELILEASGNVNLDTVRAIAETGVDLISVGTITHSARAMDISMRIVS